MTKKSSVLAVVFLVLGTLLGTTLDSSKNDKEFLSIKNEVSSLRKEMAQNGSNSALSSVTVQVGGRGFGDGAHAQAEARGAPTVLHGLTNVLVQDLRHRILFIEHALKKAPGSRVFFRFQRRNDRHRAISGSAARKRDQLGIERVSLNRILDGEFCRSGEAVAKLVPQPLLEFFEHPLHVAECMLVQHQERLIAH